MSVRSHQVLGLVSLVLGLVILFFLREPLYQLVVVVLQLIGIFVGLILVIVGIALMLGGRWVIRRGSWEESSMSLPTTAKHFGLGDNRRGASWRPICLRNAGQRQPQWAVLSAVPGIPSY